MDVQLGWAPPLEAEEDPLAEAIARLGDAHETRERDRLAARGTLLAIDRPRPYTRAGMEAAAEATRSALLSSAPPDAIAQAALMDGSFGGFADFLVREDDEYAVWDVKLARSARVTALLQIAAYADMLDRMGVRRTRVGYLRLGDRSIHEQALDDVVPVYRHRRRYIEQLLRRHLDEGRAAGWEENAHAICGGCSHCSAAIAENDDVLRVAGLGRDHRERLRVAGIATVAGLAASSSPVPDMTERTWSRLHAQATLQESAPAADGRIAYEVFDTVPIDRLPPPSSGDVFFDFEGDPLWTTADGVAEGLEYLFGIVDLDGADERFVPFWAHDRVEEKEALRAFFDYIAERRSAYPDLHIYHYAPYETSALKRLTVRHGIGEDQLDDLLRAGVFVDLYATVRQSLRVAQPSYSIKKLEPLYMGDDLRSAAGVSDGMDSVVQYHEFCAARAVGDMDRANHLLDGIADYNRYDCVSTLRLRDWLLTHGSGIAPTEPIVDDAMTTPKGSRLTELQEIADDLLVDVPVEPSERNPEQQGVALLAAALGFYRREDKPMWWVYFDRQVSPVDEWLEPRGTLVAESVEVVADWGKAKPTLKTYSRTLRLIGEPAEGTTIEQGGTVMGVYEDIPQCLSLEPGALRAFGKEAIVTSVTALDDGRIAVEIEEKTKMAWEPFAELPMAVFEYRFIGSGSLESAIAELADEVASCSSRTLPQDPASDILARRPPRLRSGVFDASATETVTATILAETLADLDDSYLAVQGPPGTGKTYVGSRAVAELVERGWKIGVVAQSHNTVENFLGAVLGAGVDPERIGKRPKGDVPQGAKWVELGKKDSPAFIAGDDGRVLGGTAWAFADPAVRGLDLLVIDEAGQFSLAHTVASSRAARRLLLLGDPQQLPQVSQGRHPEPVETSALAWLIQGDETIPPDLGYFLSRSWRMHSRLTRRVSGLAYDGRLFSKEDVTDTRSLIGIQPGLHSFVVAHEGNSIVSVEEAEMVVQAVRSALDATWSDGPGVPPRPVTPADVIVVAPYNAQVAAIRRHLDEEGFTETQVGTVDRFQGKEAPITIVSMTASSGRDIPRGLDFLLDRHRLNVAVSRAQWATILIHSPALFDALPTSADALHRMGAFLRLVDDSASFSPSVAVSSEESDC